jgi:hypothetical protein
MASNPNSSWSSTKYGHKPFHLYNITVMKKKGSRQATYMVEDQEDQ